MDLHSSLYLLVCECACVYVSCVFTCCVSLSVQFCCTGVCVGGGGGGTVLSAGYLLICRDLVLHRVFLYETCVHTVCTYVLACS